MDIVYEDADICVINKPYGADSEETAKENGFFAVHRLDKTTKGLIVFAKNKSSASSLSAQITDGSFSKRYFAVCEGTFAEKSGLLEDLLFHDRYKNKTYVVERARTGVKKALLEYNVIREKDDFSYLDIKLLTGRTHQIRAQLASRAHPLIGDRRYGAKESGEIALASVFLEFIHPKNGEKMTFALDTDNIF